MTVTIFERNRTIMVCFGKKACLFITVIALLLLCSCEGHLYKVEFSAEKLEYGLLSIEVVEFYYTTDSNSENSDFIYNVVSTIDENEEKNIIQTLSEIDFVACSLPFRQSKYGLKLNYADRYMVFSRYTIDNLDKNYNFIIGEECQHSLSMNNEKYNNLLEKYIVDPYAEQEIVKS